ncbi:uncharacterized protein [Procambarus clarkii]|uniref:uncharacterized protein n=1 Tax=Procambarus clarkii TaxID=6728 RepID=UPI003742F004
MAGLLDAFISTLRRLLITETPQEEDFQLFEAITLNGERHTLLKCPRRLPSRLAPRDGSFTSTDVFNILMADVSGSMSGDWPHVVTGWQESIKDKLSGHTKIFVFESKVTFVRDGTDLTQEDFKSGRTDLTSALRTVRQEVDKCTEQYVRIFIVTDGAHCEGEPYPETEINQMKAPQGKTVDVFLLGIGCSFPVKYSIDMRSLMHNGSANLPTLFWAKETKDIEEQMIAIGKGLSSGLVTLSLNHNSYKLPGLDKATTIHLGEWSYFPESPEDLPVLTVKVGQENPKLICSKVEKISMTLLLNEIFRQWNSVLIQQHRKKLFVPSEIFDLMDSLFKNLMNEINSEIVEGNSVKLRLKKKMAKNYEVEYATLMNTSKTVIGIEGKYRDEMELAENILRSTVTTRKYDTKNLKMKGHGQEDYDADMKAFCQLYQKVKKRILELPNPTPEECCRITMSSTLQDMQDPDFHLLFEENKFDFLKCFTMTGIPVYAPVRDASQINPWTLGIKHILVTPFTILSQRAIEAYADSGDNLGVENKDVILQKDDEKSRFNAIIPVVPAHAASVLKPLVRSNLYAMLATFCILKNPHIVDHNAHIAALGCAWVKSVVQYPPKDRPEYITDRLKNIISTASLYMARARIVCYVNALKNNPQQALMTESIDTFDDHTLKCESLIKPLFFLYLEKEKFTKLELENILILLLAEFIGRCLSNYLPTENDDKGTTTPFTDFFAEDLNDPEKKKSLLEKHCQALIDEFQLAHGNLVDKFFTLDDLQASIKQHVVKRVAALANTLMEDITIKVNMKKVKKLKNFGSCGDVKFTSFHSWAQEMGIAEESIQKATNPSQVLVYVSEALEYPSSKDRRSRDLATSEQAFIIVKERVTRENVKKIKGVLLTEVEEFAVKKWQEAYSILHTPLVMPLTREQVIEAARSKGIEVTKETFSKVYRYNADLKLLRNACQIPGCPHYLVPHRNFNQHLAVERTRRDFPHSLHLISHQFSDLGIEAVVQEVTTGTHTGRQNRPKPPVPEASSLNPLMVELDTLLQEYKKNHTRER